MDFKGQYMSGLVVSSEGKLFMDSMLQLKKSPRERPATVGRNGHACVVGPERRIEKVAESRRRRSVERRLDKFMRLRAFKRKPKVSLISSNNLVSLNI